ncbi:MAG: extracellular solute-binding protein [Chloroflexota bacterium]|nr:extracellular solute-binding protein [Chloroflexota bacterium]
MFINSRKLLPLPIITFLVFLILLVACSQADNRMPTRKTKAAPTSTDAAASTTKFPSLTPTHPATSTPTATPEPVSLIDVDPGDLENVNIRFWHAWTGPVEQVMNEIVAQFNKENEWGIQVQAESQGTLDQLYENVQAGISENKPPDLSIGYLYQALDWDAEQELVNLNDYVDDPIWGLTDNEQADYYEVFWEHDIDGERRVGFPIQRYGQMLYYNVSWAYELGFTAAPTTVEEFREQACAAAQANLEDEYPENDGTGGWIVSTDYSAILGWLYAFGADIAPAIDNDPENSAQESVYDFHNPQVEDAFTFLRELYDEGCAWIADSQYPDNEFADRLGLFAAGTLSGIPYQADTFQQTDNDDQWTVIPYPSSEGKPVISIYGPSLVMFPSTEPEQLAAWMFIKWLTKPENQVRMIEKTGSIPLDATTLVLVETIDGIQPQWSASIKQLQTTALAGVSEPGYQSWRIVRWAVSDAATQLFRYYFTIDKVPELVKFLHQTANDLHEDALKDSSIKISTPTPDTTRTPESTQASPKP